MHSCAQARQLWETFATTGFSQLNCKRSYELTWKSLLFSRSSVVFKGIFLLQQTLTVCDSKVECLFRRLLNKTTSLCVTEFADDNHITYGIQYWKLSYQRAVLYTCLFLISGRHWICKHLSVRHRVCEHVTVRHWICERISVRHWGWEHINVRHWVFEHVSVKQRVCKHI